MRIVFITLLFIFLFLIPGITQLEFNQTTIKNAGILTAEISFYDIKADHIEPYYVGVRYFDENGFEVKHKYSENRIKQLYYNEDSTLREERFTFLTDTMAKVDRRLYTYLNDQLILDEMEREDYDKLLLSTYSYNEQGLLSEKINIGYCPKTIEKLFYDEKNNLIKKKIDIQGDKKSYLNFTMKNEYNENNQLIKSVLKNGQINSKSTVKYTYDTNDRLIEKEYNYKRYTEIRLFSIRKYVKKNSIVKQLITYDERNLISKIEEYINGELVTLITCKY